MAETSFPVRSSAMPSTSTPSSSTPSARTQKVDAGFIIAGRYQLIEELGRGTMGTVWKAEDHRLVRLVAVKMIGELLVHDADKLEQFEDIAKAVGRLRSPHIVQLIDYGVEPAPFMVMELLHGQLLRHRFATAPGLELTQIVAIVSQIAKALEAAHGAKVVHRHLNPGSVFVTEQRGEYFAKVFDFGTAKTLKTFGSRKNLTTLSALLGAPANVAPEQLSGDFRSDERADVWALATIAFQALTGSTPFQGEGVGGMMQAVLKDEPLRARDLRPELPVGIDEFFRKAFDKDRDGRFQTAFALADALNQALEVGRLSGGELAVRDEADDAALPRAIAEEIDRPLDTRDDALPPFEPPIVAAAEPPHGPVSTLPSRVAFFFGALAALALGGIIAWLIFGNWLRDLVWRGDGPSATPSARVSAEVASTPTSAHGGASAKDAAAHPSANAKPTTSRAPRRNPRSRPRRPPPTREPRPAFDDDL